MIRSLLLPGLMETESVVRDQVMVVRDGIVNMFVVRGSGGLLCFDMGWRPEVVTRSFALLGLDVKDVVAVFVTHSHWDHAGCRALYGNADLYAGDLEIPYLRKKTGNASRSWLGVKDGQIVSIAGMSVLAIHTPGHTRGSMSYMVGGRLLFTGDTIRIRHGAALPYWSWFNYDNDAIRKSISKLALLHDPDCLLTGHSGITYDIANAFRRWRGVDDKVPEKGVGVA